MAELTVTVAVLGGAAVAMTVRPSDSSGASSPRCSDTSRRFLPRWFIPSVLFLSSPRLYLSISQPIFPCFLCFSVSVVSLSTQSVSLSRFPPFFCRLLSFLCLFPFPPPFFLHSDGIYRGRGSWNDPAPSHRCAWGGKPPLYLVTAPAETSNGDVACRTRPLCLLIMRSCRWRPVLALKHVGGRDKGKKKKLPFPCCTSGEEEEETLPPQNGTVSSLFFFFNA